MIARRLPVRPVLLAALVLVSAACADSAHTSAEAAPASPLPPPAAAGPAVVAGSDRYRPPVVAPVVDAFRPPPGPFAAGNRGLEYETEPDTPVGAIGAGRVIFAGSVGGSRHVTVLHEDGLRSSYSYLESIAVELGARVRSGQEVGRSTRRLHLGVRAGDAYLDPALLFGTGGVHLVPVR